MEDAAENPDTGVLALSKLTLTAKMPGAATVRAWTTDETAQNFCGVSVQSADEAPPAGGGGGGGCGAPLSDGAGAAFFTLAAASLIKKARR
jgi:hypothetical protein